MISLIFDNLCIIYLLYIINLYIITLRELLLNYYRIFNCKMSNERTRVYAITIAAILIASTLLTLNSTFSLHESKNRNAFAYSSSESIGTTSGNNVPKTDIF